MSEMEALIGSKPYFHSDPIEQLAFELAFELEEAEMSRNDLVTVNRDKLKAIAARVIGREAAKRAGALEHWRQEVGKLHSQISRKDAEIKTFRAGIKRLSDEEEKLAETTDGEELSLVSIAAQLAAVEISNRRLRDALRKVEWWAQQSCPCHEETPNPCPLCGASVENLEACKAVESVFPRDLLETFRAALSFSKEEITP